MSRRRRGRGVGGPLSYRPQDKLRRRLKKWRWLKAKANRIHLENHERDVILRDIAEAGGAASASELRRRLPGRYHEKYLASALKRMHKDRDVRWGGYTRRGSPIYKLHERHNVLLTEVQRKGVHSSATE